MFFALSKLLYFLIDPVSWILALLVWYFFTKSANRKKRLLSSILVLFVIFTNPFLFNRVSLWWQPKPIQLKENSGYSVGILLGGMSYYDKYDRGFFGQNADRFIQTANLYHTGVIKKILLSGGSGRLMVNEPDEASFLGAEFIRNGVKPEDILFERKSRNTYENAIYSKRLLDSLKIDGPHVVITSAFHMPRSIMIFKKAGFTKFVAYPCDYSEFEKRFEPRSIFIPEVALLGAWRTLIKEWVGIIAYKLTGKA